MRQKRQRLQQMMAVTLGIMILGMCGCEKAEETELLTKAEVREEVDDGKEGSSTEGTDTEEEITEEIYVYVCGEVRNPGVYQLEKGNRVTHAIFAAGGMTDKAADSYLNQAELLEDGQKIYVPDQEEAESGALPASAGEAAPEASDGKININTADKTLLTQLNGIGESRAEAIISYRESKGAFQSIEEIKNVDGIKEGIFEKIKEQIKVE